MGVRKYMPTYRWYLFLVDKNLRPNGSAPFELSEIWSLACNREKSGSHAERQFLSWWLAKQIQFWGQIEKIKVQNFNQKVFNQLKYNGDDKEEKEDRYDDDDENYDFHRNVKQAK